MDNLTTEQRIELAIADLESQDVPNCAAIARLYKIERSTLRRRYNGQTVSRKAAMSEYH